MSISSKVKEALADRTRPKYTPTEAFKELKKLKTKAKQKLTVDERNDIRRKIRLAKETQDAAIAYEKGQIHLNIAGYSLNVKRSYISKLKEPQKYIEGMYARKMRNAQNKAYDKKDFNTVVNLETKLRAIKQKSGVSKYKLGKSKNYVVDRIEKVFGSLSKTAKEGLIKKVKKGKKYTPIASYENNIVRISYV